jgi:adenylate kinase
LLSLRCLHFDSGYELRQFIRKDSQVLTATERELVARILRTGALLEDERFPVPLKIFQGFLTSHKVDRRKLIVLNGLPRHTGQAEHMKEVVRMQAVISLECTPEVVMQRINMDAGGDRVDRIDDSLEEVQRKLDLFRQRTAPLMDYYKTRHVSIISIEVGPTSSAADTLEKIDHWQHGG